MLLSFATWRKTEEAITWSASSAPRPLLMVDLDLARLGDAPSRLLSSASR